MKAREIQYLKVFYQRNVDLGIDSECHECTSHSVDSVGYITCQREGFSRMHQWMHYQKTGERPLVVMHTCDNRKCINPSHLMGGDFSANAKDRDNKGRHVDNAGENHGRSKLTKKRVQEIVFSGLSNKELSDLHGVDRSIISRVRNRKIWRSVAICRG